MIDWSDVHRGPRREPAQRPITPRASSGRRALRRLGRGIINFPLLFPWALAVWSAWTVLAVFVE